MPPIKMTRSEYEAKYGKSSITPSTMQSAQPAQPVKMTRAQYEAKYNTAYQPDTATNSVRNAIGRMFVGSTVKAGKIGGETIGASEAATQMSGQVAQNAQMTQTALKQIREAKKAGRDTTKIEAALSKMLGQPAQQFEEKNKVVNATTGQVLGAGLGMFGEVAGMGTYGKGFLALTAPKLTKTSRAPTVLKGAEAMIEGAPSLGRSIAEASGVGGATGAVFDIASYMENPSEGFKPWATAMGVVLPATIVGGLVGGKNVARTIAGSVTKEGRTNKYIAARRTELEKLTNNYPDLKKQVEKADRYGVDVNRALSDTDYLHGSVDDTGTIRTLQDGGAVQRFTFENISPKEGVARKAIMNEGAVVHVDDVEKHLVKTVMETRGLEGETLTKALAKVQAEVDGLKLRADANGNVPVVVVHDAKITKGNTVNYLDPQAKAGDKAITRGLKEVVERRTKTFDIANHNRQMQGYYAVRDTLIKLDRKKVEGGRLGKYFAGTIGAMVGGHAGGPLGALAGAELGRYAKGAQMAQKMKGRTGISVDQSISQSSRKLGSRNAIQPNATTATTNSITPSIARNWKKVPVQNRGKNTLRIAPLPPKKPITDASRLLPQKAGPSRQKPIPLGGQVLGQKVDASGKFVREPLGKSSVSLMPAKSGLPRANPKTGKMEKTFTSEIETVSKVPDLPKTAKSSPQIENLHKQIVDNVKAQERALKKGDIEKLSVLKKAYNYLIKKWNALVKSISDTPNKQGGFVYNPLGKKTTKEITKKKDDGTVKENKDSLLKDSQKGQLINSGEKEVLLRPLTPTYQGAKNITLKTLDRLKGKSVVSKQFISDLTNNADLKQPERDLIHKILEEEGDKVDVIKFGEKVEMELLPLTTKKQLNAGKENVPHMNQSQRYENISLPADLRGPIAKYEERIYESPIKTSAGSVHFDSNRAPNYFAHTRIEDLPNLEKRSKALKSREGKTLSGLDDISDYEDALRSGTTRRIIEIQSDLFQKGRLEREVGGDKYDRMNNSRINEYLREKFGEKYWEKNSELTSLGGTRRFLEKDNPKLLAEVDDLSKRRVEIARLEPYRNAWQDRIIREEVKQAALDGKTKLQFPTGETAMQIEGLGSGQYDDWMMVKNGLDEVLEKESLEVGLEVNGMGSDWIVTDVLGDGKFKAVPKNTFKEAGIENPTIGDVEYIADMDPVAQETFDISGKVDKENPIYKFYEKEVGRYLKNKYNATRITDAQGVEWYEVAVDAAEKSKPVQAFGKASLGTIVGGGLGTAGLALGMTPSKQQYARTTRNDEVGRPHVDIDGLKNAIALNETGVIAESKQYSYSKPSGSRKYGNDNGKYQITDAELKERSKQFVGRLVSRAEFLANPSLQEQYMRGKIEWLIKTYGWGPEEILAAHRGGMSKPDEIERIKNERSNYVKKGMLAYLGS